MKKRSISFQLILTAVCLALCYGLTHLKRPNRLKRPKINFFTVSDQLKSHALLPQEIKVKDLDGSWRSVNTKYFLHAHSATLLRDPDEQKPSLPTIPRSGERGTDVSLSWNNRSALSDGSAVPISNDGYFLTANHVVNEGYMWLVNMTWPIRLDDSKKRVFSVCPIRVVFKSEKADFAIIKSSFKTPNYLKIRRSPLKHKELLFSGGVLNSKGVGYYEKSDRQSGVFQYGDHWFHELVTSIPLLPGDSGSPVIDMQGRLCGIAKKVNSPLSYAVILRHDEIKRIIEKDRAANKLVDQTSLSDQP